MSKKIVVCCDGTGNQFGEENSNVVKLYQTLVQDADQVAYYHPGVGTMGARSALTKIGKWWTRMIGLAFGYGVSDNIADAYQFLMHTFEPGDEVYVFGFSRGAYTARALCGMLHVVGLLLPGNEGLIPYAIRMIRQKQIDFGVVRDFNSTFCRACPVHFIGVWDTVSSMGWVYDPIRFPYTRATNNPDMHIVRHAVSIDERRAFYRQNLFGDPHDANQSVSEVWFAGVHSDVGGSYPESQSQLSKIALRWMLDEAVAAGLRVDPLRTAGILGAKAPFVAPDPLSTNLHKSLHGWWWLAEVWPKAVNVRSADGKWRQTIRPNFGRGRTIAEGSQVHESVEMRLNDAKVAYHPGNIPAKRTFLGDHTGSQ